MVCGECGCAISVHGCILWGVYFGNDFGHLVIDCKCLRLCQRRPNGSCKLWSWIFFPAVLLNSDECCVQEESVSDRVATLEDVADQQKYVFGLGDRLRAVTLTANAKVVQKALQQGVHLEVFIHRAVWLTGLWALLVAQPLERRHLWEMQWCCRYFHCPAIKPSSNCKDIYVLLLSPCQFCRLLWTQLWGIDIRRSCGIVEGMYVIAFHPLKLGCVCCPVCGSCRLCNRD